MTTMQAKIYETEKVAKVVAKLLKHFDNGNKGNTTYINTYRLSKYLTTISHKEKIIISTKVIKQIYEALECLTNNLGGWYIHGKYKMLFAIPHNALSKISEEELMIMTMRCINNE